MNHSDAENFHSGEDRTDPTSALDFLPTDSAEEPLLKSSYRRRTRAARFTSPCSVSQRLPARNFFIAEGSGESKVINSSVTGWVKLSDFAWSAIRLRIHRAWIAFSVS